MAHRRHLVLAAAAALTVAAAACGTSHAAKLSAASAPPTQPSTTAPPAPAAAAVLPLTGLPAGSGVPDRPALAVKVDNVPAARPQSGLNNADLVFDTLVEGGLTRLFAVFQSQDADLVGPIRSARPVDADLLRLFPGPVFGYSGAALGEIAPVHDHGNATLVNPDNSDQFHREKIHRAPSNLYSSTGSLWSEGKRLGNGSPAPARPPFAFGAYDGGTPATSIASVMGIRSSNAWHWNGDAHVWERDQDGAPDVLQDGSRITATNVVVMSTDIRGTGIIDAAGEEDPFVSVLGSGSAWIARDGKVTAGTWKRDNLDDAYTLTAADGTPIPLAPGRTWVELLPVPAQPQIG